EEADTACGRSFPGVMVQVSVTSAGARRVGAAAEPVPSRAPRTVPGWLLGSVSGWLLLAATLWLVTIMTDSVPHEPGSPALVSPSVVLTTETRALPESSGLGGPGGSCDAGSNASACGSLWAGQSASGPSDFTGRSCMSSIPCGQQSRGT